MELDLSSALAALRQEIPALRGVYLFGSRASGHARPDSDVDLAIYAGPPLPPSLVARVRERIANLLKQNVDLVDLSTAPTILQIQVIDEGNLIDAPDPDAIAFFEVRAMRDYYDLKERRAPIEADIVKRGSVYAR